MILKLGRHTVAFFALTLALALASVDVTAAPEAVTSAPEVKIARNKDMSRIEFGGTASRGVTVKRSGQTLVVRIPGKTPPDLTRLRLSPPPFIKSVDTATSPNATEVTLTLAEGADAASGMADGAFYINAYKRGRFDPPPAPKSPATTAPKPGSTDQSASKEAAQIDPRPASGVLPVAIRRQSDQIALQFAWKAPVPAAVFRRGDGVWAVFDSQVRLDTAKWPSNLVKQLQPQFVSGPNLSALRVKVAPGEAVSVSANAGTWTLMLGPSSAMSGVNIAISGDEDLNQVALTADLPGAGRALWINDPVVGDRLVAVPAMAPVSGLAMRREFVDMALLKSVQGLAIEPIADDLNVVVAGNQVRIGRPKGLALSDDNRARRDDKGGGAPQAANMPGLVDFEAWSKTGSGGFVGRYTALFEAAAAEAGIGTGAPISARMALARFMVGSDLAYEGIGILNTIARSSRGSLDDPNFRGLRGAAKAMAGHHADALADLSVPELAGDPASALWRGYSSSQTGQWDEAREAFSKGMPALAAFPALWRARFVRADVKAVMEAGDLKGASQLMPLALKPNVEPLEWLKTLMVQAELFDRMGDTNRALAMYEAMTKAGSDQIRMPAMLRATQIKQARGKISPVAALDIYDRVRMGWRGDATELKAIAAEAQLYVDLGRFREALGVLGSLGRRTPDTPEARQLADDSSAIFRSLFLDGLADTLQPVQALALFYDFKHLTPIGSDGDVMVRRLARRLVDVDLLDQAAELLKYQADNRLEGLPRSIVSTDLALVQLMNRQPEKALQAINDSRSTLLPAALNAERRVIEARAWNELGKPDNALEILAVDKSAEANDIRNDIAWRKKVWTQAGPAFEKKLGDRWKNADNPLSEDEETSLLRSAVSYSLANDAKALARLKQRFGPLIEQARQADALKIALDGIDDDATVTPTQVLSTLAKNDTFAGWAAKAKQKFRGQTFKAAPQPVKSAQAAARPKPAA